MAAQAHGRVQPPSQLERLAQSPQWLALLHINQGGTWRNRGESYVDDPAFFLAADGSEDPLVELKADVVAFRQPDSKARCRFPARYKFLARRLGWQDSEPFSFCPKYLQWRQQVPDKRVVLAFPAAYLNSPSSMFGHLFLRIDASRNPDAVLASWAVSFAAETQPQDGSFFYAFKGIVGSYPGYFSITPYADKLHTYNHLENRDIWEYRLNLTPAEVARLVDHLWELKETRFDYYFFDENCAYRLLELIQVARPSVPLLQQLRFAEVPVDAVRELEAKGFVASRHYRPSKEMELRWQASLLSPEQQRFAKRLASAPELAKSQAFQSLSAQQRFAVANLAYNYLRYQNRIGERDEEAAHHSFQLLRLISRHSPAEPLPPVPAPVPPDQGHAGHLWSLAGGQREDVAFAEIGLRYTFHDWLDPVAGYLKGAEINGLNMVFRRYLNKSQQQPYEDIELQSLQLVDIRSLAPRGRFLKPISWFVDAGIEQVLVGRMRLARYLQGGPGLAWSFGGLMPYVYLKARLENNSTYKPLIEVGGGSELGLLYYHGKLSAQLGLGGVYFANDDWRGEAKLGLNWAVSRNNALRLQVKHQRQRDLYLNEWSLSWRHYY